jgi:hypothetical protein
MTYKPEAKYPSRRSYVLKLAHDANAAGLVGRLENLVSGSRRDFASGGELLEFLAHDLEMGSSGSAELTPERPRS